MKKLLSFFLALVLVLGLCGSFASAAEDEASEETTITEEAAIAEEAAPVTDGASNGWVISNGSWYYYQNGAMATGWKQISGTWYYFNAGGVMQTGWKLIDGTWYYLKSGGAMATGWEKIGSSWYYFKSSGAMATGWQYITFDWGWKGWYYFNPTSGAQVDGWQKINGSWYYFVENLDDDEPLYCNMFSSCSAQSGSKWYLLGSGGAMVTKTGWCSVDGDEDGETEWYYVLNSSGELAQGWKKIDGTWYYFKENGLMAANTSVVTDSGVYALNSSGAWIQKTGWIKMTFTPDIHDPTNTSTAWYYSKNGSTLVTGWKQIDGTWYYFHEDGTMAASEIVSSGNKLYVVNSSGAWVQNGWVDLSRRNSNITNRYYVRNGEAVTGLQTIDGKQYYFSTENGSYGIAALWTNGLITSNGNYVESDDGKYYYADSSGVLSKMDKSSVPPAPLY